MSDCGNPEQDAARLRLQRDEYFDTDGCPADDETYCAAFPECRCGGIPQGYYLRHTLDGDELVPIPNPT